jgi:hypothetical protein
MLHKNYNRKGSVGKNAGLESQGAWRQDELIGGGFIRLLKLVTVDNY